MLANVPIMYPQPHALPPPATPPRRPLKRSAQPVGAHFESPKRRRSARKDSAVVLRPGLARREQKLTAKLDALLGKHKEPVPSIDDDFQIADSGVHHDDEFAEEPVPLSMPENALDSNSVSSPHRNEASSRRLVPNQTAQRLFDNWLALIPTLEDEYLSYMQRAQGRLGRQLHSEPHHCVSRRCVTRTSPVQCLYADCRFWCTLRYYLLAHLLFLDIATITFETCECITLPQALVHHGLFPTSPTQPRLSVSIDLLDLYFALFERSADAVSALAGALKTMYTRRGFSILNGKVSLAFYRPVLAVY